MATKVKIGIAVLVLLGATIALVLIFPDSSEMDTAGTMDAGLLDEAVGVNDPPAAKSGGGEEESLSGILPEESERTSLNPTKIYLSGKVIDLVTREPLKAYDFKLGILKSRGNWVTPIHETVRDEEGRFSYPLQNGGRYLITISSSRYIQKKVGYLDITPDEQLTDLEIELDPGFTVSGRVVEEATGHPLKGVLVGPARNTLQTDLVSLFYLALEEVCPHTRTDTKGLFTLKGLRPHSLIIAGIHAEYAEGYVKTTPGNGEEVEIRLKTGFHVYGRALDDRGRPADRLLINLQGEDFPMTRPVLTGPDGRYRTAPVAPGTVYLHAGNPPNEVRPPMDFSEESKIAVIIDKDVEINFGPSPEYVTWRGTLYENEGEPARDGTFHIAPATYSLYHALSYRLDRYVDCDTSGRFEIGKLPTGRYSIAILLPGLSRTDWGKIEFEYPGLVEKDIQFRSGSITGQVVNRDTGKPFLGKRGWVSIMKFRPETRSYMDQLDKEGRFEIKGAVQGSYLLQAKVDGYPTKQIHGFKVGRGERIEDLRILISPAGNLHLEIHGYPEDAGQVFDLILAGEKGGPRYKETSRRLDETGSWDLDRELETGSWTAFLSFKERGFLERRFQVLNDSVTDVGIHLSEISLYQGLLSISGKIMHSDGSTGNNLQLRFKGQNTPGLSKEEQDLRCQCDGSGRFSLKGFKPGRWLAIVRLDTGGEYIFPELIIPSKPEDPFPLLLVLSGGMVKGSLFDERTGHPFAAGAPRSWTALLNDVQNIRTAGYHKGGTAGNRFEIEGLSAGEYELILIAEGYREYRSGVFSLNESQVLDLGDLRLEPCGLVDLEVVDETGRPVERYLVTCEGDDIHDSAVLSPGIIRYNGLPLGRIVLRVEAEGYREKEVSVQTSPGKPARLRVVLDPERA